MDSTTAELLEAVVGAGNAVRAAKQAGGDLGPLLNALNEKKAALNAHVRPLAERAKEQGGRTFGRIIGTASESALFMEPGQPNYGPAKAGIINLTVGTAKLLWKYGVTANVVMPRARTRLSHRGPGAAMFDKPAEGFDMFDPANSTPLFAYLCSEESASITGQAFVVWGKEIKILRRQELSEGIHNEGTWDLASIHEKLGPVYEGKGVEDAINVFPA